MSLPTSTICLFTWLFLIGWTALGFASPSSTFEEQQQSSGSGIGTDSTSTDISAPPPTQPTEITIPPPVPLGPNVTFRLNWRTSFPELLKSYRVEYRDPSHDSKYVENWSIASTLPHLSTSYDLELPRGPNYQIRTIATLKESGAEILVINSTVEYYGVCEDGWALRKGSCYRFFSHRNSWDQAAKHCRNEDAHLVIIESKDENAFVHKLFQLRRFSRSTSYAWIGLNDRRKEGNFVWMNGISLKPSYDQFTAWDKGEPSERGSGAGCVALVKRYDRSTSSAQGVWDKGLCNRRRRGYICEIDDGQPPTPVTAAVTMVNSATEKPTKLDVGLWEWHNGSYYRYFSSSHGITWLMAKSSCIQKGGHLVVITSEEENTFVSSLVNDRNTSDRALHRLWWIGLSDWADEDRFVWVNGEDLLPGGARWPYSNWDHWQPNNGHVNSRGQNCAAMRVYWGTWHDLYCWERYWWGGGHICEKDAIDEMNAENVNIQLKEPAPAWLARCLYDVGKLRHDLLLERYDPDGKFSHYGFVEDVSYPIKLALYKHGGLYQVHQRVHSSNGVNYTLASSTFPPSYSQDSVKTQAPFILRDISVVPRISRGKFALRVHFPPSVSSNQHFRKSNEQASWEVHYRKLCTSEIGSEIVPLFRTRLTIPNLMFGNYEVQVTARNHNSGQESSTFTTIVSGLCGHQWTWQNGKCYRLHSQGTLQIGKMMCKLQGGKLSKTYDAETKVVLSRVAAARQSTIKDMTAWADGKADGELCSVINVSSGMIERTSCIGRHYFMCEKVDLSVRPTPVPDSQVVIITEPLVRVPSHWLEATSHAIVIEKFNPQKHHFEDYMTVTGVVYPYKVRLEPGFFQVSHVVIAKRGGRPPMKYAIKRLTRNIQYTDEKPFEIAGVKVVRQSQRRTTQMKEQRPSTWWTVELPPLPREYAGTYNQWRVVFLGFHLDYEQDVKREMTKLFAPILHGQAHSVEHEVFPDYGGLVVDVTAIGTNGQESATFLVLVD